ncbi:MAG TPA: hypothetical protein EYP49_13170, partial [Anaerolineae bacterium]|nr:hypothetical protein [Anaerolineae bacterium]
MTDAHALLEALTLPIAESLEQAIQAKVNKGLALWSALHGWNGAVDRCTVARQAALNLILRALICHSLGTDVLPDVASARFILAQSNYLLQSLDLVPQPSSYLDDLAVQAGVTVQKARVAALATALQREQGDLIGDVYASWVPQDARRQLGQFWTPLPIAQLMTQWAVQSPEDRVLDPAFGSGIFLLTAIERLTDLGASVERASRQVSGVELSPLAFLMGLTNLLLHYPDARPRLQWGDFLMPEREPLATLKESATIYEVRVRQMALPGLGIVAPTAFPEQFDAIVCNPPYTRHHRLPEAYKSAWAAVMKQEYGIRLSRFSSLFAYFFVQATRMLAPEGRMAFITPAIIFEASYSRQV